MTFTLTKENANRITKIDHSSVVLIPAEEFSQGDALILFNNSDEFIAIQSEVENTYRSASPKKRKFFEFPPRSLVNAVFIDKDILVITVGI